MVKYSQQISSEFCDFLYERYKDYLTEKYNRLYMEDQELKQKVDKFVSNLAVFQDGLEDIIDCRLKNGQSFRYSNSPFVSDFDAELCLELERLSMSTLEVGLINILRDTTAVLDVDKNNAKMSYEFYGNGKQNQIDVFDLKNNSNEVQDERQI